MRKTGRTGTVRDCMAAHLVTFHPDTDISEAIKVLVQHRISGAPVIDYRGNLIGLLSEQDCLKVTLHAAYHAESAGTVSEYMSREVKTIDVDTTIVEAAELFLVARHRRYPVVDENRLVGQVSRRDILKALIQGWPLEPR